jgi:hypothetical protein
MLKQLCNSKRFFKTVLILKVFWMIDKSKTGVVNLYSFFSEPQQQRFYALSLVYRPIDSFFNRTRKVSQ